MKKLSKLALTTLITSASVVTLSAAEVNINGDMQFRIRGEKYSIEDKDGDKISGENYSDFSTKAMWNVKLHSQASEKVTFDVRLSNPNGSGLETITSTYNPEASRGKNINGVALPRAEATYTNGAFKLGAGILEVPSNTALTLAAASEKDQTYKGLNSSSSWGTAYNSSAVGLTLGYKANKFALNTILAVAGEVKNTEDDATTPIRAIIDAPINIKESCTITPIVAVNTNVTNNKEESKVGINFGADFKHSFSEAFSLDGGLAYGMINDEDLDTPTGLLAIIKPTYKFASNKVSLGYSLGLGNDDNDKENSTDIMNHIDFKWGYSLDKKFTIMPRFRAWFASNKAEDKSTKLRPELIFVGKF